MWNSEKYVTARTAMKRFLIGAVLLSAIAAPMSIAGAADLPVKASPVWAPPPATGPLWEGIYVGFNVGEATGRSTWCTDANVINCETGAPTELFHGSTSGWVGGGQFGDRWQTGNFVYGFEGMIDALTIHKDVADPVAPGQTLRTSFASLGSVTAQGGLAFDRLLAYAKGGWAITDLKLQNTLNTPTSLSASEYVNGWTIGGGLEYQVIPHFIVGVEYDYYQFSPSNLTNLSNNAGATIPCAFCNFGSSTNIQTIMARVSIQAGPVPSFH
jgi:outer membrane immunogenic protein